jgi:hypothetical protein
MLYLKGELLMSRDRVSKQETKRLELSDGDWILVKARLNAGDQRKHDVLAVVPTLLNGVVHDKIDWTIYEFCRADLWIVDWSLTTTSSDDKIVPLQKSFDSMRALDDESFNEINDAVLSHILEIVKAKKATRMLERNPPSESNASPISQS